MGGLARTRGTRAGGRVVHRNMRWRWILIFFLAFAAWAANVRLYMADGGYQLVREYQALPDRVRFYSVERSEWEEMPLDLVDLKRTEAEASQRQTDLEKSAKVLEEEEKAERDLKNEVSRIPQDPGVYWVEGGQTKVLKQGESTMRTSKGRSILRRLTPIPVVSGKGTVELDGAHSASVFTDPKQEFYFQLSQPERFGIFKVTPKGAVRIVENVTIMPVSNQVVEEPEQIPTLQRELAEGLYKIWPRDPLPPGEYALVQFTAGQLNMQIWDFAVRKP